MAERGPCATLKSTATASPCGEATSRQLRVRKYLHQSRAVVRQSRLDGVIQFFCPGHSKALPAARIRVFREVRIAKRGLPHRPAAVPLLLGYFAEFVVVEQDMLTYNPKQIMSVENAEQRMVLLKTYGVEKMLWHLDAKTIDKKDEYELITIRLIDRECEFLKMKNPSTGEFHVEGVKPGITTVNQALAWRSGLEIFNGWSAQS